MSQCVNNEGKIVEECPVCGFSEFYVSVSMSGKTSYFYKFNSDHANNSELHECLTYRMGKTAFCAKCNEKIGKLKE